MKKFFKKIINKLVRLIYGKDYIISIPVTDGLIINKPKSKKEVYFQELSENRGRIIELMNRTYQSIDQDMVELAIAEDLKISAIKYNDWKRVYNKIKGFNDPSDELQRLIAQDNLGDKIKLEQKNRRLDMENVTIINPKKKSLLSKKTIEEDSKKLIDMLTSVKENFPKEMGLAEAKVMDDAKSVESDKVMGRILSSKKYNN